MVWHAARRQFLATVTFAHAQSTTQPDSRFCLSPFAPTFGSFLQVEMVNISEVKGNARENRTAAHTHIKGLGLRSDGTAEPSGHGFVGQGAAREVCRSLSICHLLV